MNKDNKIKLIKIAVENALTKHSAENVDIVKEEETGAVDLIYHSRHNSFPISVMCVIQMGCLKVMLEK